MFSARNVLIVVITVLVIALVSGIAMLVGEPDSNGTAADSYGTKWYGARAAYELLTELGTPVSRSIDPPSPMLPPSATLVLWQPDPELVSVEPSYLHAMRPWIERGGRIIITPRTHESDADRSMRDDGKPSERLETALGLPALEVVSFGAHAERRRTARGMSGRDVWRQTEVSFSDAKVRATGEFLSLGRVDTVRIAREDASALQLNSDAARDNDGTLSYTDATGTSRILAVAFRRGAGLVVVWADPVLLQNAALRSNNAVWFYDLAAAGGRSVVIDEFYHGLAVRGNPLWLLTRSRYAVGAAVLAGLVALIVWRHAAALGPPLESTPRSRRTIVETVKATAWLFYRARNSRPFVLNETYRGALRYLGEHLNLPPGECDPESIARALERRKPAEAERFRAATAGVEAARRRGARLSESEVVLALQGICRCL